MRATRTRVIAAATATITVLGLAVGCTNKYTEPFKDAPRSGQDNGAPMDVIRMSDGFSNVGAKCDGPNRVYVAYHGDQKYASLAVVANDPRCTKR
jgi:hypothetical protein